MQLNDTQLIEKLKDGVSVVGNATSLLNTEYGSLIDSNPTVRFNWSTIKNPVAQGRRWDFISTGTRYTMTFNKHLSAYKSFQFHTVLYNTKSESHNLDTKYKQSKLFDWHTLNIESRTKLYQQTLPYKPSSGLHILNLLDYLQIENVCIFGFDSYATKSFYTNEPSYSHDYEKEHTIINSLIEKNQWKQYK
jgi:hypothetical protein